MKNLFLIFILLFTLDLNAQDTLRLKVMTYNLRFGELATIDQLAEHIKAFHPDFVALEEVDVNTHLLPIRTAKTCFPNWREKPICSVFTGKPFISVMVIME